MALTDRQRHHLNLIQDEINELRNLPVARLRIWAENKEIPLSKLSKFVDRLETFVQNRLTNETWPAITDGAGDPTIHPYEIHDFLQKRLQTLRDNL